MKKEMEESYAGSILSEIPVCNAFNLPDDGWQRQAAYGDRLQKTTQ